MAIGVGVCTALVSNAGSYADIAECQTWTFLRRSDHVIFTHQAMLAAVALLNMWVPVISPIDASATLVIMIVDLRAITSTSALGDLFTRDTVGRCGNRCRAAS